MKLIKFFKYYYGLFQLYQYYRFLRRPNHTLKLGDTQIGFEITPKVAKAFWSAVMLHHKVRQKYGDLPYGFHLKDVFQKCYYFMHQIQFTPNEREMIFIAVFFHDSIEDARLTFGDLCKMYGLRIAEIVYCCTNEKGKTRKDRANDKFYDELVQDRLAVYVKLGDRVANTTSSKKSKPGMYNKYVEEMPAFLTHLSKDGSIEQRYKPIFDTLREFN